MIIKRIFLSAVLLIGASFTVLSQQLNVYQQRRALDAALTTVENYSVWSTVANQEAYYEFLELFVNKNSLVYNDLLGIKRGNSISAGEYAQTMQNGLHNKKVFIKNIRNEGVASENGQTRVRLSLDKAISYVDSCGTYYSSSEFYEKDYHLLFTFIYDEQSRSCKIESITGKIESDKRLPSQYVVFASEDDRDVYLFYRNLPLHYNSYHQTFIEGTPATVLKKDFSYPDQSIALRPVFKEGHMLMKYRTRRFELKAHYDFGMGSVYTIDGLGEITNDKNSVGSFGFDIGYVFSSSQKLSLGIFTGLSMSSSQLDLTFNQNDYSYESSVDVDGDSYIRHYQNLSLSQTMQLKDLSIPVYLDANYHFSKIVSVYADLGIGFNINLSHKIEDTYGDAYIFGVYPQYGNITLNENWPYNGFGNHQFRQTDLDHTEIIDYKSSTWDLIGNIGFRFNIPDTPLAVDLGVNYQMGLGEVLNTVKPVEQNSATTDPIVYNTLSGENSVEHVKNLTEAVQSIKRKSLRLSFGLIWKF